MAIGRISFDSESIFSKINYSLIYVQLCVEYLPNANLNKDVGSTCFVKKYSL